MLNFPDDTPIRVNGLEEILTGLHFDGRQVNQECPRDHQQAGSPKELYPFITT